jgi:hypothetical protein
MGAGYSKSKPKQNYEKNIEDVEAEFRAELIKDMKLASTPENIRKRKEFNELNANIKSLRIKIINFEIKLEKYIKDVEKSDNFKKSNDSHDINILKSALLDDKLLLDLSAVLKKLQEDINEVENIQQYNEIKSLFEEVEDKIGYLLENSSASGLKRKSKKTRKNLNNNKIKSIIKKIKTKMKKIKIKKSRKTRKSYYKKA